MSIGGPLGEPEERFVYPWILTLDHEGSGNKCRRDILWRVTTTHEG